MGKKDPNAPKRPLSAYFIFMGKFPIFKIAEPWSLVPDDLFLISFSILLQSDRWKKSGGEGSQPRLQDWRYCQGNVTSTTRILFIKISLQQAIGKMWQELDEKAKVS